MKKWIYIFLIAIVLTSCKDNDINVFDRTADERVADAISSLKADLIAPANGWRIKYKPESESGSFYVLMKFDANNNVTIKTDLSANDGEFFEKTITYRIDNSLGIELIMENYSFFSYLFEQDQATFPAEFEFIYVKKTDDNALVFKSKTDLSEPTILLFEEAAAGDVNLLGKELANNLNLLSDDLQIILNPSFTLTYVNKDLIFYCKLNETKRLINISSASKKTNTLITKIVDFTSGYILKGDSIVFDKLLKGSFLNTTISLKGIKFNTLGNDEINICADPIAINTYQGVTSGNQDVIFESTIIDPSGKEFTNESNIYFSPLSYIYNNGISVGDAIMNDIPGAVEFDLYYDLKFQDGTTLNGIGFVLQRADGSYTYALREFDLVLINNNVIFNLIPGFRFFYGTDTSVPPDATLSSINNYLNYLMLGDHTYVFKQTENRYEFYNPCTGWSFILINGGG